MEDRSLDEFVAADDGSDADGETEAKAEDGAESEAASEASVADIEAASTGTPATPTMRFVRSGTCPVCDAATARLWNDGEQFVCADCKEF